MKSGKIKIILLIVIALITSVILTFSLTTVADNPNVRKLTFVARDVKFNGENPKIVVYRGERVELTVINKEPGGISHNFLIAGLGVKTSKLLSPGESDTVTFTPDKIGIFKYSCSLHPGMMQGEILVQKK